VPADSLDDAVAETFLTAWRRIDDVPDGPAALAWVYQVAYRVVGREWRSSARRGRLAARFRTVRVDAPPPTDDNAVDGDESQLVLAALERLGDTDVEVLRLMAWERLSPSDIAVVLGIEPEAARQRLHRAREHLSREYERLQSRRPPPAIPIGGVS
jgi:RNA polymerase sigma-70 factor (ECF subfamily)